MGDILYRVFRQLITARRFAMNQPWGQVEEKTSAMHIGFTGTKL
jgi:hypothetical protein